ncbi:MAG: tripartite tricarboxylate transporter substrate binding protein [Pigmentiphaga sp.]|nr:tripartite tricarboxylate transporter substrate binding protein [Pigmentiphaga sp.]
MFKLVRTLAAAAACIAMATPALVQAAYPDRPVRLIVPYPPGASTDTIARLVAEHMSKTLGQPIVVENRGGASGTIGSTTVAHAAPDGYTFGMGTDGSHATSPHLMKAKPYDPIRDFTPITMAVKNILVLVANNDFPPKNVAELVTYAKEHPEQQLSYGSSGLASPHFLAGALLGQMTDIDFIHVPYKGGSQAVVDVLGGQIPLAFSSMATVEPQIRSGKLKALGVTERERYSGTPDIPAIAESLPGFEMDSWLAFFGPANMNPEALEKLNSALVAAINDPAIREQLLAAGMVPVANSPREFAEILKADVAKRGKLIQEAGIEPQ